MVLFLDIIFVDICAKGLIISESALWKKAAVSHFGTNPKFRFQFPISVRTVQDISTDFFPLRRFLKVVEMSDEKKPIWPTFKRSDGEYQKLTRYLTSYPNP